MTFARTSDVIVAASVENARIQENIIYRAERVRFEIAGGSYRLIVAFKFRSQIAYVRFIGTHADYDKVDALTV